MIQQFLNTTTQQQLSSKLLSDLESTIPQRRHELASYSGLRLAGLILDYGVMLDEKSDPIEVILDYEFSRAGSMKSCVEAIIEH